MHTMTAPGINLPRGETFTREVLEAMPDDGNRYELVDGVLIVTPGPRTVHQDVCANLFVLLRGAAATRPELKVLFAPLDVTLAEDTVIEPDLVVAPRSAYSESGLPTAPLLAVEILSPASRAMDLQVKKERLERAGCPHYWVVDPDGPTVIAWTVDDGTYRLVAEATGDECFHVTEPFDLRCAPQDLLDGN
jgi:Uma2 family endonuclease